MDAKLPRIPPSWVIGPFVTARHVLGRAYRSLVPTTARVLEGSFGLIETKALGAAAELVVVIGRAARRVSEEHALDHVLGYTCGDDISARDLQFGDTQWTRGKALDTFAPMGPWIVTADEIPDPQTLGIRCFVNGEVRQDDTTAHMLFPVAQLIAFITEAITLKPGDVIYSGTPPGVGHARQPPAYLQPGDTVRVEIDRIGTLEHQIVSA